MSDWILKTFDHKEKKIPINRVYKTHTMYQLQTHTKLNEKEFCIRSQAHFLFQS